LAAETFDRVEIPERVIIIAPKHTPPGADWAVAPYQAWSLPGGSVPSDAELAQRLSQAISGLELDAAAHQSEHAIEVQLPILASLAPQARLVGIVVHGGGLPALERFADQLAGVLAELPERPLLVISSDMNHFAPDDQTRLLDRMALDAMESLDPVKLYQTVLQQHITMCGVLPAVLVMETLRRLDGLHRCELVGYATSADASHDRTRVVGYAGMLLG
jgi:AmmeMemoRadiSam system protein B